MIYSMQRAIIKKDLRSITANKRLLLVLLIVPFVLAVFVPSIFILSIYFTPEDMGDFQTMLGLLSVNPQVDDISLLMINLVINSVMPVFFTMIPIMAASVMAASSFVGEKEKRTLETLLYCPLTLKQIFQSKILASFIMSMIVSFASFAVMFLVVETEALLIMGTIVVPGISWLVTMLLLAPAISLIAITLIVGGSAKAKTMEESQQRAAFLVLPVVLLVAGQFSGLILVNAWVLLGLGIVFAVIAVVFMKIVINKFNYRKLIG